MKTYRAVRGTRDILPDEAARWQFVEATAREHFHRYGFREIRTPVLEATELFARGVGESTDIVRKEMYTFAAGEESVTLRPENTASVVRAFVEHSLHRTATDGYPERLYYLGPMFRHERPQKGRQRQFHQIGVEVLGAPSPWPTPRRSQMLSELAAAAGDHGLALTPELGGGRDLPPALPRGAARVASRPGSRSSARTAKRRYAENPLRVFDCKVEADRAMLARSTRPPGPPVRALPRPLRRRAGARCGGFGDPLRGGRHGSCADSTTTSAPSFEVDGRRARRAERRARRRALRRTGRGARRSRRSRLRLRAGHRAAAARAAARTSGERARRWTSPSSPWGTKGLPRPSGWRARLRERRRVGHHAAGGAAARRADQAGRAAGARFALFVGEDELARGPLRPEGPDERASRSRLPTRPSVLAAVAEERVRCAAELLTTHARAAAR